MKEVMSAEEIGYFDLPTNCKCTQQGSIKTTYENTMEQCKTSCCQEEYYDWKYLVLSTKKTHSGLCQR